MTNILFTHPSAELYGSDKTLLQLVEAVASTADMKAFVALPRRGVLADRLESVGATVEIGELGAAMRSDLAPGRLRSFMRKAKTAARFVEALVEKHEIDIVHTNTSVLVGAAYGAKRSSALHVWHVHEILDEPAWAGAIMRKLIRRWSDLAVANSRETARAMIDPRMSWFEVVHNGVDPKDYAVPANEANDVREAHGVRPGEKLVVLPGRINSWKGQMLLVDALSELRSEMKSMHVVIAGDAPPGQEHFAESLDAAIASKVFAHLVKRIPFTEELPSLLAAADVCVVPSTRPEPFGMVAIEAMAAGTPVIAAAHGGLTEIIDDHQSGRLFEPRSAHALADVLRSVLGDDVARARMGSLACMRQREFFTVARYRERMLTLYGDLMTRKGRGLTERERLAA